MIKKYAILTIILVAFFILPSFISAEIYNGNPLSYPIFTPIRIRNFLFAFIDTLILEIIAAFIFVSNAKISKKVLISVLIANIISHPIVWFVFPLMKLTFTVLLFAEIFAFVFEAFFIYLLNKKNITLKNAFVLSAITNLVSLIVGGFIHWLI